MTFRTFLNRQYCIMKILIVNQRRTQTMGYFLLLSLPLDNNAQGGDGHNRAKGGVVFHPHLLGKLRTGIGISVTPQAIQINMIHDPKRMRVRFESTRKLIRITGSRNKATSENYGTECIPRRAWQGVASSQFHSCLVKATRNLATSTHSSTPYVRSTSSVLGAS